MKGDFTRFTFDPKKPFARVLKQQGRVDLDADWNESAAIQAYLDETRATDVIGQCGVPKFDAGFGVTPTPAGDDLTLTDGRLYAGGIVCVAEGDSYASQPDLPNPPALNPQDGRVDLVYLDIWQRHVTAVEDPELLEPALGGADTTTRLQTVWQVRVRPGVEETDCEGEFDPWPPVPPLDQRGKLTTSVLIDPGAADPCLIPAGGGYRGLENRLYRVEIHDGDGMGAATFKWSRDNGAVVYAVEDMLPAEPTKVQLKQLGRDQVLALQPGDWVEVLDEADDLWLRPGTMAKINQVDAAQRVLTLDRAVTAGTGARVRRWDQGSDVIPVAAGPILLEDGVQIAFSGADFQPGDYWTFAARTATGKIDELSAAPPQGVEHHFCRLAIITWAEDTTADEGEEWADSTVEDCRPHFPPLTKICAEDVCYDDSNCDAVNATTVQEALDQLCALRDLSHHNKHLHGWGVVCGLQVECEDDPEVVSDRVTVIVRPGYALDCEGRDLVLDENLSVPVLELVQAWEAAHPNQPLLKEKDGKRYGEFSLVIELDANGQPQVDVRPYTPNKNPLEQWLKGSILADFYRDCIAEPFKELIELLTGAAADDDEGGLVSARWKQLITLVNLLVQFPYPLFGKHVYLSDKEDDILRRLYFQLRDVLQSKTFCAMFDDAPQFPDYPFEDIEMSTIFGLSPHTRLRIHPSGAAGYAVGYDDEIHVFDLRKEELVKIVEMPGGEGLVVQDVAFSADGEQLYAIGSVNNENTVFAAAEIQDGEYRWRPVTILCDVVLKTLARPGKFKDRLLAVGRGEESGLFLISKLNDSQPTIKLVTPFKAAGHLVLADDVQRAFASAASANAPAGVEFDQVLEIDWSNFTVTFTYQLPSLGAQTTGRDDIAVVPFGDAIKLYAVASVAGSEDRKLCIFPWHQANPSATLDMPDTQIRLAHVPGSEYLIATAADWFLAGLVEVANDTVVPVLPGDLPPFVLPLQIGPMGIAVDPNGERVYFLNGVSRTITVVSADYLQPTATADPIPGNQAFYDALVDYRAKVFAAFVALIGGLVQYLKDCFCHHLLVNCPECGEEDEVYLAAVQVRDEEVFKVCNFSQRQYVKSFPTMGYWLSFLPITPLVDWAVEQVCCMVFPNLLAGFVQKRTQAQAAAMPKATQLNVGLAAVQSGLLQRKLAETVSTVKLAQNVTGDWLGGQVGQLLFRPQEKAEAQKNEVVDQPLEKALENAEDANATIERVEKYDPSLGLKNLQAVGRMPATFAAGDRLVLYEQDGVVRYFVRAEDAPKSAEVVRVETEAQQAAAAKVEALGTSLEEMKTTLAQKDQELVALRGQLQTLEQKQATLEAAPPKVAKLETELKELRTFKKDVQDFMTRMGG